MCLYTSVNHYFQDTYFRCGMMTIFQFCNITSCINHIKIDNAEKYKCNMNTTICIQLNKLSAVFN